MKYLNTYLVCNIYKQFLTLNLPLKVILILITKLLLTKLSVSDSHVALQEVVHFLHRLLLKFCWLENTNHSLLMIWFPTFIIFCLNHKLSRNNTLRTTIIRHNKTHLLLHSSWALWAKSQSPSPVSDLVVTSWFGALWPGLQHFCQSKKGTISQDVRSPDFKSTHSFTKSTFFRPLKHVSGKMRMKSMSGPFRGNTFECFSFFSAVHMLRHTAANVSLSHSDLEGECVVVSERVGYVTPDVSASPSPFPVSHSPKAFMGSTSFSVNDLSLGNSFSMRATS